MARISKQKLTHSQEQEMFKIFWSSLSRLGTSQDCSAFFSDLLSDTEEVMLAKRFMIALLLERGKKAVEVSRILHVSYSMIGSVHRWLGNASPATKKLIKDAQKAQNVELFMDKVDELLDALPPLWGTNWTRVGKEKWARKQKRITRARLT